MPLNIQVAGPFTADHRSSASAYDPPCTGQRTHSRTASRLSTGVPQASVTSRSAGAKLDGIQVVRLEG